MIHAAADGIALGASASHPQLSMVVFFAIMLHKGPSAFALTTVLLAEGMSRVEVRKHLLLFSMAAPTGALVTYLLLSLSSPGDVSLEYWTGVLLLFSGGTFLYVAMHALQELPHLEHTHVACILFGMFLPVLLNLGHSH
jgi:zinc transporter 9